MQNKVLKIIVPLVALSAAALHGFSPDQPKVDAIVIALLIIGLLPWIGSLIESLKYGDLEIKLRKAEAKAEEAKGAAESARLLAISQTETAAHGESDGAKTFIAPAAGKEMAQMELLAQAYAQIRKTNPPGDFRTALMTEIMSRMRALAPHVGKESILPWLEDADHARRLAAYAFLHVKPDFTEVDRLLSSVGNPDNPPFAQYWGIMALQKLIGTRGQAGISAQTKANLKAFLSRLRRGTDRHYELTRLLKSLEGRT
jgi:hypothetical protein